MNAYQREMVDDIKPLEQALTFSLAEETYGVNILRVQEIRGWEQPTPLPEAPDFFKGVINIRGAVVPIIDLRIKFNLGAPSYNNSTVVIITKINASTKSNESSNPSEKIVGLVVDGVNDVEDIDLTQLQKTPEFNQKPDVSEHYIRGLVNLSQDHAKNAMVILLDVDALLSPNAQALMQAA
jgi:purine-binding chemotaxis protein CheW